MPLFHLLNDDDEKLAAAPETPAARVKGRVSALAGEKVRVARFRDFTLEETNTRKHKCKLAKINKCGRCLYLDLMANDHGRFAPPRPNGLEAPEGGGACQVAMVGPQT